MTLSSLWDSLLAILRKESKGLAISPDDFTDLLQVENLSLFNEYYRAFEARQEVSDALRRFKTSSMLNLSYNAVERARYASLPALYKHHTALTLGGKTDFDWSNGSSQPTITSPSPGNYTTLTSSGTDITSMVKVFGAEAAAGTDTEVTVTADSDYTFSIDVTDNMPVTDWYAYSSDATLASTNEYINSLTLDTEAPGAFIYSNSFALTAAEDLRLSVKIVGVTDQFKICLNNKATANDTAASYDVDTQNLSNGTTAVTLTAVAAGNYRLYIRRVVYDDGSHTFTAGQFASDLPVLIIYDLNVNTGQATALNNSVVTTGEQFFTVTPTYDRLGLYFVSAAAHISDLSVTAALYSDEEYTTQIDFVTDEEWVYRRADELTKPTASYPIARLKETYLYVYPSSVTNVLLLYLREPATPFFDYYIDANLNIQPMTAGIDYNLDAGETYRGEAVLVSSETKSSLTVELEWDDLDKIKILHRILAKLGVSMDEQLVAQYALSQKDS